MSLKPLPGGVYLADSLADIADRFAQLSAIYAVEQPMMDTRTFQEGVVFAMAEAARIVRATTLKRKSE